MGNIRFMKSKNNKKILLIIQTIILFLIGIIFLITTADQDTYLNRILTTFIFILAGISLSRTLK